MIDWGSPLKLRQLDTDLQIAMKSADPNMDWQRISFVLEALLVMSDIAVDKEKSYHDFKGPGLISVSNKSVLLNRNCRNY